MNALRVLTSYVVSGFSRTTEGPPKGGRHILLLALAAAGSVVHAQQPVTFDRILRASQEPQNWLTYSGNLSGHRHTLLTQITPANVKNLELQWVFQTRTPAEP